MKALIIFACGAFAGACAPTEVPRDPASLPQESAPLVTGTGDAPGVAQGDGVSGAPSRAAELTSTRGRARLPAGSAARSQLSTVPAAPLSSVRDERAPIAAPEAADTPISGADRDRDDASSAPPQGNSDVDLMVTQQIRRAINADPSLSSAARHVLVGTLAGQVTLRGVVKSPQARKSIADCARKVAGATKVDDQLDVQEGEGK